MSNTTQWLQQLVASQSTPGIKPLKSASNPFSASGSSAKTAYHSEEEAIGKNQPYFSPRFLGYHGSNAVYGGGRLNVCC